MGDVWYRLDNVAKVFAATSNRRDPRVFRLSCTLDAPVDAALLDAALKKTARQFQSFQLTMHRGLFWYYLESTDHLPEAVPETLPPCAEIYSPAERGGLLYRVSYYGCRVSLEVFHVLSDGTGALAFLKTLICHYLKACHPEALADAVPECDTCLEEREQDSFRQFYGRRKTAKTRRVRAYHLRGLRLPYDQTQFFELHLPAAQTLALAKGCGVTLTSYLGAALVQAIYAEMPVLERARPITIGLPVNLRNYYPSGTSHNFFNTVWVSMALAGGETQAQLAAEFDEKLRAQLSQENVMARMDAYEELERIPAIKPVPLILKDRVVSFSNWLEKHYETATVSNMGRISFGAALDPYIRGFTSYCSTSSLFVTISSWQDDLVLGAASAFRRTGILRRFVRGLAQQLPEVAVYATHPEE